MSVSISGPRPTRRSTIETLQAFATNARSMDRENDQYHGVSPTAYCPVLSHPVNTLLPLPDPGSPFGKPFCLEMRKTLREAGGPVPERMGMAGIPALMGIDISGSLKTRIPLVGAGTPSDTLYGVYGGFSVRV